MGERLWMTDQNERRLVNFAIFEALRPLDLKTAATAIYSFRSPIRGRSEREKELGSDTEISFLGDDIKAGTKERLRIYFCLGPPLD